MRRARRMVSWCFPGLLLLLAGCSTAGGYARPRLGALPYFGLFTLYDTADPAKLGEHRCEPEPRWFHPDETEHGIIYTTRAGFVDVAHVRLAIDNTRYSSGQIRNAIHRRADSVTLYTEEGSIFTVSLRLPPTWPASDPREQAIEDEVAILAGQRIAYQMMVWHEFATWFGYRSVAFLDESPSAFTYDDTMSHVLGVQVAGRALREKSGRSFDEAVTAILHEELVDLGAVSPRETDRAVAAVEGTWWWPWKTSMRNLDIGLTDNTVRPWLVPGFDPGHTAPDAFKLADLSDVDGWDFSNFYSITIEPRMLVAYRMRELVPGQPAVFDCDRDFPILLQATRAQMLQHGIPVAPNPPPLMHRLATTAPADRVIRVSVRHGG